MIFEVMLEQVFMQPQLVCFNENIKLCGSRNLLGLSIFLDSFHS